MGRSQGVQTTGNCFVALMQFQFTVGRCSPFCRFAIAKLLDGWMHVCRYGWMLERRTGRRKLFFGPGNETLQSAKFSFSRLFFGRLRDAGKGIFRPSPSVIPMLRGWPVCPKATSVGYPSCLRLLKGSNGEALQTKIAVFTYIMPTAEVGISCSCFGLVKGNIFSVQLANLQWMFASLARGRWFGDCHTASRQ